MKHFLFSLFVFSSLSGLTQHQPTDREMEMIDEINYVRTKPAEYIQYIQSYLDYWNAGASEIKAAKELIGELKKMKPLAALTFSQEMYDAAYKHGQWMKSKAQFAHSDYEYAENLVSGDEKIRFAIISLLIDDGIPSRGHRKNILDPSITEVACREIPDKVGDSKFVFVQEFQ